MKNIAIIPARSGSKGLPDKNIKELNGRPLIAYSIEAALNSGCFDTVMVSTDSEKYADISRSYGAEVPFLRSEKTSSDSASSWDTVLEVLDRYESLGKTFDTFCLLQPTSPMRTANDIKSAYEIFEKKNAFAVLSMTELEHPFSWCGLLGEENSLNGFMQKTSNKQRQAQDIYYRPNGAIYIVSIPEFKKDQFLYREDSYAYIMPKERSVDIDTESDFRYAQFLLDLTGDDKGANSEDSNRDSIYELIVIPQYAKFKELIDCGNIKEAEGHLEAIVFLCQALVLKGETYNHELSDLLLKDFYDYAYKEDVNIEKQLVSAKRLLQVSHSVVKMMNVCNVQSKTIIIDRNQFEQHKFSNSIYSDMCMVKVYIESLIDKIEGDKVLLKMTENTDGEDKSASVMQCNSESNLVLTNRSVNEKPSRISETPFQFIEEDSLIACVGDNGGTSNYDIFEGFAKAVAVIYRSVAESSLYEDAMVYPMAFSARHGIELALKISIQELKDFLNLEKLESRVVNLDRNLIDKVLHEHNIKSLRDSFVTLLSIDKRLASYEKDVSPYLSDYYFDEKGDMFRYAESRDEISNLASQNINHVGLTQLYKRFSELVKCFEKFYSQIGLLYEEYKTGSYTKNLSREDISRIANRLPEKSLWTEQTFDTVRDNIKKEYNISSRELSDAINIIKEVPEFSVRIGMEKKFLDIQDEELDAYRKLVEWYNDEKNSVPDTISIAGITVETIGEMQRNLKGTDMYAKDISDVTLNALLVFYMIADENTYVENIDKYYEYVKKSNYHRDYLVRKLARKEIFHFVKIGMKMCGQESYLKRINFIV